MKKMISDNEWYVSDNLFKSKNGKRIKWEYSIGREIKYNFNGVSDTIKILDYNKETGRLRISSIDKEFDVGRSYIVDGTVFNIIFKSDESRYKYQIGKNFKDDTRNITIISREIRELKERTRPFYKYRCNVCGWDCGWVSQSNINGSRPVRCSCCNGRTIVTGINDVATTNPELIKYFKDKKEANEVTVGSTRIIDAICPNCGFVKQYEVNVLKRNGFSCPRCSDGISYGEKFVYELLSQLGITFTKELTSKILSWCDKFRYDFYFKDTIIEVHGLQHYREIKSKYKHFREYSIEHENDTQKRILALDNGVKNYIEINASISSMDYIKNSIMKSKLPKILNFTEHDVDWRKCDDVATSSIKYKICSYANAHKDLSITSISKRLKLNYGFVYTCVSNEIKNKTYGFDLDSIFENGKKELSSKSSKPIICNKLGIVFSSKNLASRIAFDKTGVPFSDSNLKSSRDKYYTRNHKYTYSHITKQQFNEIKRTTPEKAFGDFFILEDSKSS